nr:MAG TPA: hypothetical protein [Caudoviricetes sp.]
MIRHLPETRSLLIYFDVMPLIIKKYSLFSV